jgi:hypothetical protein
MDLSWTCYSCIQRIPASVCRSEATEEIRELSLNGKSHQHKLAVENVKDGENKLEAVCANSLLVGWGMKQACLKVNSMYTSLSAVISFSCKTCRRSTLNFSIYLILQAALGPADQPLTEISTRKREKNCFWGAEHCRSLRLDNLSAICEPTV